MVGPAQEGGVGEGKGSRGFDWACGKTGQPKRRENEWASEGVELGLLLIGPLRVLNYTEYKLMELFSFLFLTMHTRMPHVGNLTSSENIALNFGAETLKFCNNICLQGKRERRQHFDFV